MDPDEDAQAFLFRSSCGHHCRDEQGRSSCGVYGMRPQACKDFEVRGEECVRLRKRRAQRMKRSVE
jgi:hypothetical protein